MKTNANVDNVIKAVNTVSESKYSGNVIFRKEPQHITKNVVRFTLKTKDAEQAGSIVTKNGQKHPKANWQVHMDVIKELFKLEPKAHIYVDTIAGRLYNDNIPEEKVETVDSDGKTKDKFLKALKFVFDHKELLEQVKI